MPLLTLHLLSLQAGTNPKQFADLVRRSPDVSADVVVASRARHPVVRPKSLDAHQLLDTKWDLLLLLQPRSASSSRPSPSLQRVFPNTVSKEYSVFVGIPSKLLSSYPAQDAKLKREAAGASLTGALDKARGKPSSQNLELSPDLLAFMDELTKEHDGPVTMLNLLHFNPGGKPEYYKYGQGFVSVAGKRGGNAKIVGNVVKPPTSSGSPDSRGDSNRAEDDWWNEISIVHYPSIRHFCDMLAGEDYQEINAKHRLAALRDTFLLCTTEFDVEGSVQGARL